MNCFRKLKKKKQPRSPESPHTSLRRSVFKENPKILIIGAGVAGIACATKLIEYGFKNIIILESSDRIGGRILTIPFADNVIDLGAQWCHGEENNVVFNMLKDRDVLDTTGNVYVTFQCIRSNGDVIPESLVTRLKTVLAEVFNSRTENLSKFKGSFGEFLSDRYYEVLNHPEYEDIDTTLAHEFFETFKRIESSETASGVDEVSATSFNEYWECSGDYLLNFKQKGYDKFLKILTKADEMQNDMGILQGKIVFNMTVENILWVRPDSIVEVKCKEFDEHFEADHVVVTMSLGVLKERIETLFNPEVPPLKRRAIEGLGYGSVCKIFLEFGEKFWPSDWTGFCLLWRKEDSEEFRNTPRAWLEEIYGFYCVNYQPRVLLGWAVGPVVEQIEALPKAEVRDSCVYLLRRFLPNWEIPEPEHTAVSMWQCNPNFRGAYSFRSMLTEEVGTSANELAQPLTLLATERSRTSIDTSDEDIESPGYRVKPVVLFAGEATSSHYFSTVHGAVESGWREANRLAGYYETDL